MSELQIQRGERGRWPKKKPVISKSVISKPVGRRKAIKQAAAALAALRVAGFVAWSEPKEDEHVSTSSTTEEA